MKSLEERVSQQTTSTLGVWRQDLKGIFTYSSSDKRVALVGMGHPLRSDDYVGSYVVKKLAVKAGNKLADGVYVFDGEDSVEALITRIAELEPEHVIFIDACEMRAEPGGILLISVVQTSYPFFTTHGVPLKLLAEQLLPKSQVWLLAIQPKHTDFGEHLSNEVRTAADAVTDFFVMILKERYQRTDDWPRSSPLSGHCSF